MTTGSHSYSVRQPGAATWHIPDRAGRPLCGAVIEGRPERRYLPARLEPADVVCECCQALRSAAAPQKHAAGPQARPARAAVAEA